MKPQFEGIDSFIAEKMADWSVPGLAIAIVKDKEIIFSQGYGFRDVKTD